MYGCSNGAKFSFFYYICSVLSYLYSVSHLFCIQQSHLLYRFKPTDIYSVSSSLYSVKLCICSFHFICVQSDLLYIRSSFKYIFSHMLYVLNSSLFFVITYVQRAGYGVKAGPGPRHSRKD